MVVKVLRNIKEQGISIREGDLYKLIEFNTDIYKGRLVAMAVIEITKNDKVFRVSIPKEWVEIN